MFKTFLRVLKNTFFWSYERGTWQYDLMVAAILLFVFLTPRKIFRDQPTEIFRISETVTLVESTDHEEIYLLSPQVLPDYKNNPALMAAIQDELRKALRKPISTSRIEPVYDEHMQLQGFRVWVDARKAKAGK